ncbi:MAG: PTS sugar transporter subunit IIB [Erysipelotrichaceae bacterium]|nr:PTS sugar transporter subunit IIB [Bacillota bacterium]HCY07039.1 PTS sugar transporter [Erysipelotrichaceae bacterium]
MTSEIRLTRVDFRLMHGQVVTNWIKQVSADSILIIDDELATNKFLAQVFLMAAPPGIKVAVRSIDRAVTSFKNDVFKNKKLLLLFKSVDNVHKAVMLGLPITELQIGGLGSGTDKIMISNELSINHSEAEKLKEISEKGIEVSFQVTPKDPKISLEDVLSKVV